MGRLHRCCSIAVAVLLASCAHHPADDPSDPLEPVNRAMWTFNSKADQYVLKPAAKGYVAVTPGWAREGVTNFFSNLVYPTTIVNDVLQAKFTQGAADTGRFVVNSIWGIGEGWYLMIPFLGPSDNRDLLGRGVDMFTNPTYYLPGRYDLPHYLTTYVLDSVNIRANALPSDSLLDSQFDTYLFIRTAYLQHRQALVYDGNPPPEDLGLSDYGDDSTATPSPAPVAPAQKPQKSK